MHRRPQFKYDAMFQTQPYCTDGSRMSTISIRQAAAVDLEALSVLFDSYRQFYGRDGDVAGAKKFLSERFQHGESVILIAHDESKPVGFTQLYPSFSSVSLGRIFILNDLFVDESGRRKGVGSALLGAAVEYAQAAGAIRLALSTAHNNTTAQTLYASQGWQQDDDFFYVFPIR